MLLYDISDQSCESVKRSKIELQADFSGEIYRLKLPSSPLVDVHHGSHSLTHGLGHASDLYALKKLYEHLIVIILLLINDFQNPASPDLAHRNTKVTPGKILI